MKNYEICIVGLGYVGLPLAIAFAKKYSVTGFDTKKSRILELQDNFDNTNEISSEDIQKAKNNIRFTYEHSDIEKSNVYIITVPTPIDSYNKPNLKPLIESSKTVGKALKNGDIVVYESTVYPGATEDVCIPVLEEISGLKFNKDFFCGYSPERINPGDKKRTVTKIMKVTSGSTKEIAKEMGRIIDKVTQAGHTEMIKYMDRKVLENNPAGVFVDATLDIADFEKGLNKTLGFLEDRTIGGNIRRLIQRLKRYPDAAEIQKDVNREIKARRKKDKLFNELVERAVEAEKAGPQPYQLNITDEFGQPIIFD